MSGPRSSISELLGQDHRALDELFEQFQRTPPAERERRARLFSAFAGGLRRHIDIEERDLFPIMTEADAAQRGLVELLLEDHQRIEAALKRIEAELASKDGSTETPEFELTNVLWEHNAREENVVYPLLDAHVDLTRKEAVGRRLAEEPSRDPESPPG